MFTARIIATIIGLFFGGPVGAIIGFLIGSFLDNAVGKGKASGFNWQKAFSFGQPFVRSTFILMGHLAKADGTVTPNEISIASSAMSQLRLSNDIRHQAMRWFYDGKNQQFDLAEVIQQLHAYRHPPFMKILLACLTNIAYANGAPTAAQQQVLKNICAQLGITASDEQQHTYSQYHQQNYYNDRHHYSSTPKNSLADDYQLMGLKPDADVATIRKTYRRMMNKFHPDKLSAKGATEKEIKAASDKTIKIRSAYENLMQSKGVTV